MQMGRKFAALPRMTANGVLRTSKCPLSMSALQVLPTFYFPAFYSSPGTERVLIRPSAPPAPPALPALPHFSKHFDFTNYGFYCKLEKLDYFLSKWT